MLGIAGTAAIYLVVFVFLRHAFPGGVLLYQGVALALVFAVGHFVWWGSRKQASGAGKDAVIVFLLLYAFVFTVPTTVDRAYSVRMLELLARDPLGMARSDIEQWFSGEFLKGNAVAKRLEEQRVTGTIVEQDGRVGLTALGRLLVQSFRVTEAVFACGHRE